MLRTGDEGSMWNVESSGMRVNQSPNLNKIPRDLSENPEMRVRRSSDLYGILRINFAWSWSH